MEDKRRARSAAGRLVGRERQIETVERVVDGLQSGELAIVTITGELGVGKTLIADEALVLAERRGYRVLRRHATGLEPAPPFGLIGDLLDLQTEPSSSAGDQETRHLLERLSRDGPLVLVLDDLQWADSASVDALARLLRDPPAGPVALVLISRRGQWPSKLTQPLRDRPVHRTVTSVDVGRLTPGQMEVLLDGELDSTGVGRIHRESGGNPLFALLLAKSPAISSVLRATVAEDLASLAPPGLALLRAGAVIRAPFDPRLGCRVAQLDERDDRAAVQELVSRGLVQSSVGVAQHLTFSHPVVRRVVYEDMGPASRLAAHRRTARALAERGRSPRARAHHLERAGRSAREDLDVLLEAAEASAFAEPPIAASWFTAALRGMPETDERRLGAVIQASAALLTAGRIDEGRERFETAARLVSETSLEDVRSLSALVRAEHMLGVAGPARALLRQALARPLDDRSVASLRAALALDYWRTGEATDMASQARLAFAAVRRGDLRVVMAPTLVGLAEYARGNTGQALDHVAYAERLLRAMPDSAVLEQLGALTFLGYVNYGLERYSVAAEHLDRGIRLARDAGNVYVLVPLGLRRAAVEVATGNLHRAPGDAAEMLELAAKLGSEQLLMWVQTVRAGIALERGSMVVALDAARQAARAADEIASGFLTTAARCCLGVVLVYAGHPHAGRDQILRHAGGAELDRLEAGSRPDCYATLATAARFAGELDRAQEWVERAEASAAELGLTGRIASARSARARLLLDREPVRAAELAQEAAKEFESVGRMSEVGCALALAGEAQTLAGDGRTALATLERAYALLVDCGAERQRDLTARALRRLGRRISRPPGRSQATTGVAALSRREREVAELVAEGLTNKRIADQLFVSAKTVEDHLARAFAKLGVASRAGLAAAVESRRDGQPQPSEPSSA